MKFLKNIFGLNGRLDRRDYLLLGVLPMVGWIFLVYILSLFQLNSIILLILFIPIFILVLISAIKRGRDIGLNGLITILLFGAIPILIMFLIIELKLNTSYLAFIFIFIAYLLLIPSSSEKVKVIGKVEYLLTIVAILLVFPLLIFVLAPVSPCIDDEAQVSLTCNILDGNAVAIKMFKLDNGDYPTTEEGLNALVSNPNALKYSNYPNTPYYEKLPKDAWGKPIIYIRTKDGFELISYGADRQKGGEDDGADILYSECQNKKYD